MMIIALDKPPALSLSEDGATVVFPQPAGRMQTITAAMPVPPLRNLASATRAYAL